MVNLNKIKILAKEKGWSLSFLCEKLGLAKSYFTDVKNGKTSIPQSRLEEIASLLNTSAGFLLDKTDEKERQSAESELSMKKREFIKRVEGMSDSQLEKLERILALVENTEI